MGAGMEVCTAMESPANKCMPGGHKPDVGAGQDIGYYLANVRPVRLSPLHQAGHFAAKRTNVRVVRLVRVGKSA
jgi:hypothetical protein